MFWKIVECLNNIMVSALTPSEDSNIEETNTDNLKEEWQKKIWYSSDDELNRYLDRHGLYFSVEQDGRYKCENVLIDYFVDRKIDPYYI